MINTEIERKFLIRMPDIAVLRANGGSTSDILQTYLVNPNGCTERVRMRRYADKTVYYHTIKKRISSASAYEDESVISEDEYKTLLMRADKDKTPISKTRCCVPYENHICEIDIYPFWKRQAVLEIELSGEDEAYSIPPYLSVICEVTGNHDYSNNSLSSKVPPEKI